MEASDKRIDEKVMEQRGTQVVHVRGNSDSEMEALFQVLEPTSSRPLQKPLKMRNLPASFFSPPQHRQSPIPTAVSHSREGSSDSTYGGSGMPVRVGGAMSPTPQQPQHFRHHSSPASLQQSLSVAPQPHVHAKQHSFDALSEDLPPGWEKATTPAGQVYFINHNTQTTTWEDPRKKPLASVSTQLPQTSPQAQALTTLSTASVQPISSAQPHQQSTSQPQPHLILKTTGAVHHVTSSASNIVNVTTSPVPSPTPQSQVAASQTTSSSTTSTSGPATNNTAVVGASLQNIPLPEGWQQGVSPDGDVYFMNHNDKTTTWYDPRIPRHLQTAGLGLKAINIPAPVMQSANNQQAGQQHGQASTQLVRTLPPLGPNNQLSSAARLQLLQQERTKLEKHQERLRNTQTSIPALASSVNTALVLSPTLTIAQSSNELMNSSDPFMAATEIHNRQGSADSGLGLGSTYTHPHTPEDFLAMDSDVNPAETLKQPTSSPMIVGSEEPMDSEDLVPSIGVPIVSDDMGISVFLNDICTGDKTQTWF